MDFRILGPLEVVDDGRPLALGGQKQRSVLAVLLLHPNEVVSTERLIDALWGDEPPETAGTAVQVHVSQLRKAIGPDRIETRVPGYVLRVRADELDAERFERLVSEGNVRSALDLWRGPALADFAYEGFAQGAAARLEELRVGAMEELIGEDLAAGRHRALVATLDSLVRQHPLRERLRGHLMLALYRSGRQAEALAQFQETRRLLVEELGIEPGPELQRLYKQVLDQDPALEPPLGQSEPPAPPPVPREERKVLSVLFCDLVGFTSKAESLDPEDVSAMLSLYHVRLRAELERHGGTVEKFVGDAVMALFGAPAAHEDDALRAVRAGLAIRDWISEQEELEVRVAVNTGEALVRLGARPQAGESMAVGDVINTASRMQQAAPPGQVVVGERTYWVTKDDVVYESLEPIQVKGKSGPISLWLARALHGAEGERPPAAPLIGRDGELALLQQTYARVLKESSVHLATIVGEPGIGKSRLASEFRLSVEGGSEDVAWRQGRCLPYGEGITFWALGEIVKTHAGILESDTPETASAKLASSVDSVAQPQDRAWLFARLAPLIGTARREQPVDQSESFAAWRTFLEGLAARQPLVLLVEDLHWADAALLAFLDHLVDWSADVPLLVIGTARPELYEREPGWGGGKRNSTTISLGPLTHRDTERLVSDLLAHAALPPETQAALLDRAGGNPLYAEEFVRMLGDRGFLASRDGVVEIAAGVQIPVPETVQAVIAARLDTLGADRKALLHDASVVGKVFWAGAVAALGGVTKEAVLAGLHELGRKELVRRSRSSSIQDDVEYTFWHVLVRDVAYAQIPRARRAGKHVASAEWIERISGERITDHAEFLAHHYRTALDLARSAADADQASAVLEPAVRFGALAGKRALRLDQARGERYYRDTLTLLTEDDPRRPRILAEAADVATKSATADFEKIEADLREAIRGLQEQGDVVGTANAMRQLSFAMFTHGEGAEARMALVTEARKLLEREPPGPELALVYERLAQEFLLAGRSAEVLEWSDKALALLDRFGLTDEAIQVRSRRASARCDVGDLRGLEEHRMLLREVLNPNRAPGTFATVLAHGNLAVIEYMFGAGPTAAIVLQRAAIELSTRRGLGRPAHWYLAGTTSMLYDLGQWDEVLRVTAEVERWESERGRSIIGTIAPPDAVRVLAARGETDAASAVSAELLGRARKAEDPPVLAPALIAGAVVAVSRGDFLEAVGLLDERERLTRDLPDFLRAEQTADAGRVCLATGDHSVLERVLDRPPPVGSRLANQILMGRAILSEAMGELERAQMLYVEAAERWATYGSVIERAHALIGAGRSRLGLGAASEAIGFLEEARVIFARLGARSLVAETNALLVVQGQPDQLSGGQRAKPRSSGKESGR